MQKFPYYLSCVQTDATTPNNVGSCCVRLHGAKSLTGVKLCAVTPNNTQQQICIRVYKRRQHVTSNNNIASVFTWLWAACKRAQQLPTLLRHNVGSCCVRVASGVQTDVTTPNKFGTSSESWEEYNP